MIAAQNATDFETVPGFVDRRRSHMSDVNNQNYAEHLSPDKAVFPYVEVRPIPYLTHLNLSLKCILNVVGTVLVLARRWATVQWQGSSSVHRPRRRITTAWRRVAALGPETASSRCLGSDVPL